MLYEFVLPLQKSATQSCHAVVSISHESRLLPQLLPKVSENGKAECGLD